MCCVENKLFWIELNWIECNNLSMHTTDDYISSIEQFQNMFVI